MNKKYPEDSYKDPQISREKGPKIVLLVNHFASTSENYSKLIVTINRPACNHFNCCLFEPQSLAGKNLEE